MCLMALLAELQTKLEDKGNRDLMRSTRVALGQLFCLGWEVTVWAGVPASKGLRMKIRLNTGQQCTCMANNTNCVLDCRQRGMTSLSREAARRCGGAASS